MEVEDSSSMVMVLAEERIEGKKERQTNEVETVERKGESEAHKIAPPLGILERRSRDLKDGYRRCESIW